MMRLSLLPLLYLLTSHLYYVESTDPYQMIISSTSTGSTLDAACSNTFGVNSIGASIHSQLDYKACELAINQIGTSSHNQNICCLGGKLVGTEWIWNDATDNTELDDIAAYLDQGGLWANGEPSGSGNYLYIHAEINMLQTSPRYGIHDYGDGACYPICNGETLQCPSGSYPIAIQGEMNDIAGCGLDGANNCDNRYLNNIEECRDHCLSNTNCKSFTWAPIGGEYNNLDKNVCTTYDADVPNQIWGPNQIMCGRDDCWEHVITASCNQVLVTGTYGSDPQQCWKGYSDSDINTLMTSDREMKIEFGSTDTMYIQLVNTDNTPRDFALNPNPNGAKWKWNEGDVYQGPCTHPQQLAAGDWFFFKTASADGQCVDSNYENTVNVNGFFNADSATFWPVAGWGDIKIYAKAQTCNNIIDIDCEAGGEWIDSGDCSVLCGGGKQEQTRNIITEKQGNGEECSVSDLEREIDCNTNPCPINCEVGEWYYDGTCCIVGGQQTEIRDITIHPDFGGNPCPELQRSVDCNINNLCCPNIDQQTFDWDKLTEEGGVNIPYYKVQDFYVNDADLSLKIVVKQVVIMRI